MYFINIESRINYVGLSSSLAKNYIFYLKSFKNSEDSTKILLFIILIDWSCNQ